MLEHVFKNFGQIDHQDLIHNRARLHEEWDPNQPFSVLVQRVQAVQEYANDGYRPISNNDIIDAIYTVIFNTGMYYDDCEKWSEKPTAQQSWTTFQAHFTEAQRKIRRRQKATSHQGGYNSANAVVNEQLGQANEALVNMATAAASDREMMQLQATTIAEQMKTISELTQRIKDKDKEIANLRANKATPTAGIPPHQKWVNGKHIWDKGGYCWSHGYLAEKTHTSLLCKNKREGHNDAATRENNLGGSTYGKPQN